MFTYKEMATLMGDGHIEILGWCSAGSAYLMGRKYLFSLGWPPF